MLVFPEKIEIKSTTVEELKYAIANKAPSTIPKELCVTELKFIHTVQRLSQVVVSLLIRMQLHLVPTLSQMH